MSVDSARHPEWVNGINDWLRAWDFYRGGRCVISPQRAVAKVGRWVISPSKPDATISGSASIEGDRARDRRLIYQYQSQQSYLVSHVRESSEEYSDRVARAMHLPLFRSIVDIYVSAVLRTEPQIQGTVTESWRAYWADADLAGTSHAELIRQALTLALVQRKAFIVVDRPSIGRPMSSRAEQLAAGDRAYAYVVPPTDLVDWQLDRYGRFEWATIREDDESPRAPGEDPGDVKNQYRVWRRDKWELHRETPEGFAVVASGPVPFGRVPIVPLFARRGHESNRTLASDGVLSDIVDIDAAVYNHLSLFHEQLFAQCFSQLAVPTEDGEAPDLELGVQRVLGFRSDGSAPLYLSPDSSLLTMQLASVEKHIGWARQLASVSRGRGAESSKEQRSGDAIREESSDKNNAIASLVGAIERADREVHQLVALWDGAAPADAPKSSYSRDVSLKALSAQIADATALLALEVPRNAMVEVVKPIMARALREQGAGEDAISRAEKAIDEAAALAKERAAAMPLAPMAAEPDDDEEPSDGA